MNWVSNSADFESVLIEAHRCIFVDSFRLPTTLEKLIFDDAELCTRRFAELLNDLQTLSGDEFSWYTVLNPDPKSYFKKLFGSYPLIRIDRGISKEHYLSLLNESPTGNPGDSLAINSYETMVLSPSKIWFIHALRSADDNGGHLWMPFEWQEKIVNQYPFLRVAL